MLVSIWLCCTGIGSVWVCVCLSVRASVGFGKQHWFVTLSWSQGQNQSVCEACCWTTHCNSVCLFDKNSSVWKENKQLSGLLLSLQKGAVTRAQHNIYITVYIILHTPLSFSHFLSVPLISLSLSFTLFLYSVSNFGQNEDELYYLTVAFCKVNRKSTRCVANAVSCFLLNLTSVCAAHAW